MSTEKTLNEMASRFKGGESLLILETTEEDRWVKALQGWAKQHEYNCVVWTATLGANLLPENADTENRYLSPMEILSAISSYPRSTIFILKDFHVFVEDPIIVRKIKDVLPLLFAQRRHLLFLGTMFPTIDELRKDVCRLSLPLPGFDELRNELKGVLKAIKEEDQSQLSLNSQNVNRMLTAVAGLTLTESSRAIRRSLMGKTEFSDDVITELVSEKKHMLQGNQLLEFHELKENVKDVGGLEGLKLWIDQRAQAFTPEAQEKGIGKPKGVLLLGVQGCGKSLSARVIARQLCFPLVRLDFSALLQSERGSSEQNLREVLQLMETIAPAVMWIEELDKGFSGFQNESDRDGAMARMVGRFLTWMQEHESSVFVVATANSIEHLPPELLRKGRFDELFFIDLPNPNERMNIFHLHLERRGLNPDDYDLEQLAERTEGYSGAEIETIVNSTIIEAYAQQRPVSMNDLYEMQEQTVPLSVTLEDKIFKLREWARTRCRPATPDSRVLRMMEEAHKRGDSLSNDRTGKQKWEELLEQGNIGDGLVELVKFRSTGIISDLQFTLEPFMETKGNFEVSIESDANVIIWQGLSKELAELFIRYTHNRRMYLHLIDVNEYLEKKRVLRLPVLKELREHPMKKKVWLPCCFRVMPPAEGSGRLGRLKIHAMENVTAES